MSFINKSVNYSQTDLLKSKYLIANLNSFNDFLLKKDNKTSLNVDIDTGITLDYIIPNNNKKFFLFITKKSLLEDIKEDYNILYFFPDNQSIDYFSNNTLLKNRLTDKYLESELYFNDSFLLEGYMYNNGKDESFLITDILMKNEQIIDICYDLRITLINEIIIEIKREKLKNINNHMTINIHPIFQKKNENMIKIFQNNFIFRNDLCCIENVENFVKKRHLYKFIKNDALKKIECTHLTDVYNVFNYSTNNKEGILYIRGIKQSKYIKTLFNGEKNNVILKCKFNQNFMKWEPIFN